MSEQLSSIPIQFTARGDVPRGAGAYALRRIEHVLGKVPGPVLHAQVTLALGTNPAQERPARIEVCFDLNGTPVRAHVAAADLAEATDLVVDRLRRRLVQLRERTRTRHRWLAAAAEHEWRHGSLLAPPAPAADRPVIRRKSFTLEPMTADEAAYEMDLLDHDFYLYADAASRADAVVCRTDDGGYRVLGPAGVPVLTLAGARERLGTGHERFVFYRDPDRGRGHVLYVRHDGRYGLLVAS